MFNGSSKLWLLNFNTGTCHNLFISPISCSIVCHKIVRNKNFPASAVSPPSSSSSLSFTTYKLCCRRIIIMIINTSHRTKRTQPTVLFDLCVVLSNVDSFHNLLLITAKNSSTSFLTHCSFIAVPSPTLVLIGGESKIEMCHGRDKRI